MYCKDFEYMPIPSNITSIGEYTFIQCTSLAHVFIPSSVVSIEKNAFKECVALKEIILPSSLKTIGHCSFNECTSLEQITIPCSVTDIDSEAFLDCYALKNVLIYGSLTSIKRGTFKQCNSLRNINIPSSVTSIESSAFENCILLEQIELPPSLAFIGEYAFKKCSSLKQISFPSSITTIEEFAFGECKSLKEVIIPSSLTKISSCLFSGCTSLEKVTIPSSVTLIESWAFLECSSLTEIVIPSSVTSIEDSVFSSCALLSQITIPSSVKSFGECIFYHIVSLDIDSDDMTMIPEKLFSKCHTLKNVKIPSSITSIGNYAFNDCNSLEAIDIPSSVTTIGNYAFCGCISLKTLVLPSLLTSLGDCAFLGCSQSIDITIPPSLKQIGTNAFLGCSAIKHPLVNDYETMANIDDYEIIEKIGYSDLYKAKDKKTGKICILRHFHADNFSTIQFKQQVDISRVDGPGIIKVEKYRFRLSDDEKSKASPQTSQYSLYDYIAVLNYYSENNLSQLVIDYLESKGENNQKMNPTIRSKIIFGIAAIMKKLHKNNVLHRNLKLIKVLLDDNLEPKLTTFWLSTFYDEHTELESSVGTPLFMAPEIFNEETYGFPVDVYAYAICLYLMFEKSVEFEDSKILNQYMLFSRISRGQRPKRPENIPDCYWELIEKCWKQNPEERLTFEQITEILKDDKFALEEFGMKTDLNQLHEYQNHVDT